MISKVLTLAAAAGFGPSYGPYTRSVTIGNKYCACGCKRMTMSSRYYSLTCAVNDKRAQQEKAST